jgi:hypothetical protein
MAGSGHNRNDSVTNPEKQRQLHGISMTEPTAKGRTTKPGYSINARLPSLQHCGTFASKEIE